MTRPITSSVPREQIVEQEALPLADRGIDPTSRDHARNAEEMRCALGRRA